MNIKLFSIFIVILLIIFGMGYSLGSILNDIGNPSVKIFNDIKYGKAPLTVSFSSEIFNLDGKIKKYEWNFNDGEKADNPKTTHTFFREGIFNVTLTVWDTNGHKISSSTEIIVIEYYKPNASATADNTSGKAPLLIRFNEKSFDIDGDKFDYYWDFDDGSTSDNKNPHHTFKENGVYNVRLTVYDSDGQEDTDSIQINVIDNYPPIASASANIEQGKAPLTVEFEGSCDDIDGEDPTYHWYFENTIINKNEESTEREPLHTFYFPGTYLVTLTVFDKDGARDTDIVKIIVEESLFSKALDFLFDISMRNFINGTISEFLGNFIGKILGNISGNLIFSD